MSDLKIMGKLGFPDKSPPYYIFIGQSNLRLIWGGSKRGFYYYIDNGHWSSEVVYKSDGNFYSHHSMKHLHDRELTPALRSQYFDMAHKYISIEALERAELEVKQHLKIYYNVKGRLKK